MLTVFNPLSSWQEAYWHTGRHGAGEGAESSTCESIGRGEEGIAWLERLMPESLPLVIHLFQQGHPP